MTNNDFPAIPEPNEFLLETPVHSRFKNDSTKIWELKNFKGPLDSYCIECGEQSIFNRFGPTPSQLIAGIAPVYGGFHSPHDEDKVQTFSIEFTCSRNEDHRAMFHFRVDRNSICKFGEFPSRAERFSAGVRKYREILAHEQISLQLAQELYAQGIGAGSFVYLRRIFENVIVAKVAARN